MMRLHTIKPIVMIAALMCALPSQARQSIRWLESVYDFGAFGEDEAVKPAVFRFVNEGDEDVAITQANATCGCTTPKFTTEAIAPGDTAKIVVSYNAEGRPGRFSKSVYVRTTADDQRHRLEIKGVVIGNGASVSKRYPVDMGPLKLRNGAAMMGKVASGKSKTEFLDGYNQSPNPITPTFKNLPPYIKVAATPETVPAGDLVSLGFFFSADKCADWGIVNDSIQICPTGNDAECYWLPVVAIIEEDFSGLTDEQRAKAPSMEIVGDKITLDPVPLHSTAPVKGSIKIANQGKSPLKIRKIYSPDEAIEAKINKTEIKPGKEAEITVIFDPSAQPEGVINSRVTLITNDPKVPTRTVRVVGERN